MKVSKQIDREVRWALYLTLFYVMGWVGFAYFSPAGRGFLGFPLWFELSCVYLPIVLTLLISAVVKWIYQDIDLEGKDES
ncbi:DUF997 family protein [Glaesserella parasuis]|uniref:Predicted membrane protein n=1 Tax=Glaesserella parasuis serovar 5 (strain SH0165) TaxID=557723 RepID=B8F881_GLAP5|nr:DUF997 family protein [Glaesserella parasuis]ACL33533.1 predicted membrane protein [Glaesserella parasuis SH0165]MDG6237071.1 DUF997 family protein [Glaesserella parasuis]MDG6239907.1 DUF997 family protein [Glaesserella parasuis]MDG6280698.1 DUF997 family protein [Glaesserella parasuis]MDG6324463.1 DUF997 family protein [Glaesserella parasuis]